MNINGEEANETRQAGDRKRRLAMEEKFKKAERALTDWSMCENWVWKLWLCLADVLKWSLIAILIDQCVFWKAKKTKRVWHRLDVMKKMRLLHNHGVGLFLQCTFRMWASGATILCGKQPTVSTIMNPCIHTKYKIIHASTCKYFEHHKEVFLFISWLSGLSASLFIHFLSRSMTLLPAQERLLFYFARGGREWNARMYDRTPSSRQVTVQRSDIRIFGV